MVTRHIRNFPREVGDPEAEDGLFAWMKKYLDYVRGRGHTMQSLWGTERYIRECARQQQRAGLAAALPEGVEWIRT